MKEKDIQRLFGKVIDIPGVFELKLCKGNALPYSAVKDHQIEALSNISKGKGHYHKIADQTFGRAGQFGHTLKKPFDCFYLRNYPAYVGICYYKPRQPKKVYLLSIPMFIYLKQIDSRKSLSEEKAKENSEHIIGL